MANWKIFIVKICLRSSFLKTTSIFKIFWYREEKSQIWITMINWWKFLLFVNRWLQFSTFLKTITLTRKKMQKIDWILIFFQCRCFLALDLFLNKSPGNSMGRRTRLSLQKSIIANIHYHSFRFCLLLALHFLFPLSSPSKSFASYVPEISIFNRKYSTCFNQILYQLSVLLIITSIVLNPLWNVYKIHIMTSLILSGVYWLVIKHWNFVYTLYNFQFALFTPR